MRANDPVGNGAALHRRPPPSTVVVAQFGIREWLLDQSGPGRLSYVVSRGDTVLLGGTADDGDLTARLETAGDILRRCAALVPALRDARVLGHRVGLRPARPTVRLDVEITGRGPVTVTLRTVAPSP